MNNKPITGISLALVTLLLVGCGGQSANVKQEAEPKVDPYLVATDINNSMALNLMQVAGVDTLHDSEAAELATIYGHGQSLDKALETLAAPGAAGLDSGLKRRLNDPARFSRLLYWQRGETSSHTDIEEQFFTSLKEQMFALESAELTPLIQKVELRHIHGRGIVYEGGRCGSAGVKVRKCEVLIWKAQKAVKFPDPREFYGSKESKYPDFLQLKGQGPVSLSIYGISHNLFSLQGDALLKLDTLAAFLKISESLPATAFIYLAPGKYSYSEPFGGIRKGQVALVLNQGKVHFFAR